MAAPSIDQPDFRALLVTPYGFQNQGVRLLAAELRRAGFDARVLFFKAWVNNNVRPPTARELALFDAHVAETRPALIGFGFGSPYLRIVTELTARVRANSDAFVIWGGVHPTISPEDGIDAADAVCVGEGEQPLLELAGALAAGRSPDDIANLWVRRNGRITRNALRPLIQNLDALAYDRLFDVPLAWIERGRLAAGDPLADSAVYRVFASRGCPFHCAFCYNSQYRAIYHGLGAYHRVRGVESLLGELETARRRLPRGRRIRFDDDSFIFPRSWIDEFVARYPGRVGLPFDLLLNPEAYDPEALRLLRDAGLCHIQAGVQSASPEELPRDYDRCGSNEHVLALARTARSLGVEITFDLILDNPLASAADKDATLDLLLELPRPFNLFLYSLTPFPKSELATKLLAAGVISENDIEGRATKSFRQFRLSFDYPRPAEETFYAALISLTSKRFIPRGLIRWLARRPVLRRSPGPLKLLARIANLVKLIGIAVRMARRGELSRFHLREYVTLRGRLVQ